MQGKANSSAGHKFQHYVHDKKSLCERAQDMQYANFPSEAKRIDISPATILRAPCLKRRFATNVLGFGFGDESSAVDKSRVTMTDVIYHD
ncbi:hypothetical protein NPIL_53871 [Nephila pilipes]|uniref:Uncharacterized protein n=1 Tax=Nephila pilipes TaxID=299642 RepID=A0A8X6PCP1_NEPPI|nr:hypothetical protein NPIL_53871 [Nephila pilipes]